MQESHADKDSIYEDAPPELSEKSLLRKRRKRKSNYDV
jgi:hypothetical protein